MISLLKFIQICMYASFFQNCGAKPCLYRARHKCCSNFIECLSISSFLSLANSFSPVKLFKILIVLTSINKFLYFSYFSTYLLILSCFIFFIENHLIPTYTARTTRIYAFLVKFLICPLVLPSSWMSLLVTRAVL